MKKDISASLSEKTTIGTHHDIPLCEAREAERLGREMKKLEEKEREVKKEIEEEAETADAAYREEKRAELIAHKEEMTKMAKDQRSAGESELNTLQKSYEKKAPALVKSQAEELISLLAS